MTEQNAAQYFQMLQQAARQVQSGEGVPFGRYRLLDPLGTGGMGLVYKAFDTHLGRLLALKQLNPLMVQDKADVERFLREARSAARLKHPNIVEIFDIGEIDGLTYFTMDWIAGTPLNKAEGLSVKRAIEIVRTIAEALNYAHSLSVVHRDIKPENIMITPAGKPVLMDFGIAFDITRTSRITVTGEVVGTPAFMSPEQATGSATLDARTDIYSLGITLYQLVTGRLPYVGKTPMDIMQAIVNQDPVRVRAINPKIDVELEGIIMKAIEKKADRRYRTAQDFADDLGRYLAGEPTLAGKVTFRKTVSHKFRRNWKVVAVVALGLVIAGAFGYLMWQLTELREEADPFNEGLKLLSQAKSPFAKDRRTLLINAAQQFSFALEKKSNQLEAKRRRAEIYLALGRPVEALHDLELPTDRLCAAIRLYLPQRSFPKFRRTEIDPVQVFREFPNDRVSKAALAANPTETLTLLGVIEPAQMRPEYYALKALAADEDRALDLLTKAVSMDPWFAEAWSRIAELRAYRKEFDLAMDAVEKSCVLQEFLPSMYAKAMVQISRGDYVGAEASLVAALSIAPERTDLLHDRAVAQLYQGDAPTAAVTFEKAGSSYMLACALAQDRQYDKAVKALKAALAGKMAYKGASEFKAIERCFHFLVLRSDDISKDPLLEPLRRQPVWEREIRPLLKGPR
jgi:tetratricopeptide (TPR) repeat protein